MGTYSPLPGSRSCVDCPPGTYGQGIGQISAAGCVPCPAGTQQSAPRVSDPAKCVACGGGTYASSIGTGTCLPCSLGTYAGTTGAVTCSLCPPGSKGNVTGLALCYPCEAGKYANAGGHTDCIPCPAGTIQQVVDGVLSCFPCPSGQFGTLSGQTIRNYSCTKCTDVLGLGTPYSDTGSWSVDQCAEYPPMYEVLLDRAKNPPLAVGGVVLALLTIVTVVGVLAGAYYYMKQRIVVTI